MALPISYLQVHADLPNDDPLNQRFALYMRELLPSFEAGPWPGWILFLSATRKPGQDPSSGGDTPDKQQYLHIWRIQDYNTLPYLAECLSDNPIHQKTNLIIQREVVTFAGALPYNPATLNPGFELPTNTRYYLHITFDVTANADLLTPLEAFMTGCAADPQCPMLKDYGFTLVEASYSQTGLLGRHFQVWATPSAIPEPEEAVTWLASQKEVKAALNPAVEVNPQWALWTPIDYTAGTKTTEE